LVSQFGGLASLGGLSLSGSERKAEYLGILQSQALIARFISQNNLIPVLYADGWDEGKNAWKHADPENQPTTWKATQYFKSKVMRLDRQQEVYQRFRFRGQMQRSERAGPTDWLKLPMNICGQGQSQKPWRHQAG
jgi:hypothetical protein